MKLWKIMVALTLLMGALPFAVEAESCNPYPVGRCGAFDRENVTLCYRVVAGWMVDATDHNVIALGTSQGVALPDNSAMGLLYVRLSPAEAFLDDPWESDLPYGNVVQESNSIRGVQLAPFKCGSLIWYAECDSWMGPFNIQPASGSYPVDQMVA